MRLTVLGCVSVRWDAFGHFPKISFLGGCFSDDFGDFRLCFDRGVLIFLLMLYLYSRRGLTFSGV